MKKHYIFAVVAILALSGCFHREPLPQTPVTDDVVLKEEARKLPTPRDLLPNTIDIGPTALETFHDNVSVRLGDEAVHIMSTAIPDHETGSFPNPNNPNAISEQDLNLKFDRVPRRADGPTGLSGPEGRGGYTFGIAVNGVVFDPLTAEFWNEDPTSGWRYEALGTLDLGLDQHNAHVQPNGEYHYHGLPTALVEELDSQVHSPIVGFAADGFPIYAVYSYIDQDDVEGGVDTLKASYRLKSGTRPSGPGGAYDGTFVQDYEYVEGLGDLDECNGRFGRTPEFPEGIYYYVLTENFPVVPRCLRGEPDESFRIGPPAPGR